MIAGPTALLVGALLSGAGTAVSTFSSIQAGKFQANVARNNQRLAKLEADRQLFTAQLKAQEADFAATQITGAANVGDSASGFALNSPSFVLRRRADATTASANRARILQGGQTEQFNSLNRAASFGTTADLAEQSIPLTAVTGGLNLAGLGLSTAGKVKSEAADRITGNIPPPFQRIAPQTALQSGLF